MKQPRAFLFYGKSGAGKGTQAQLLKEYLEKNDKRDVLYLSTGEGARTLAKEDSFTGEKVKYISDNGLLLPAFIPIWIWTTFLKENATGEEHFIIDGLARRPHEAPVVEEAISFYGCENYDVVLLDVSDDWAVERLLERKREDDTEAEIRERLSWYETQVLPTIHFYRNSKFATVHDINGEQSIEGVHKEILEKVFDGGN